MPKSEQCPPESLDFDLNIESALEFGQLSPQFFALFFTFPLVLPNPHYVVILKIWLLWVVLVLTHSLTHSPA